VFILGICRGNIPPKVLYSPKEPSAFLHRTLDTAKSPPKVSDSPPKLQVSRIDTEKKSAYTVVVYQ